ncbi:Oidioi.mRNA.OKI2018_I69.XSR.g13495.t1.cds [Oikopleura dioica]|uniref:Oidioi.mRNA.OKI2018_I69.XSR.g13495.t1.cds n=1 Tax=Oikopleura dioica TaxID=34765 RepID=A0ABN7SAS2_OIKDI|nr:Oidioi.mRNA.OKI2018_I69.XSR.g13495.t1.cds [Oikopleura dioica]
MAFYNEQIVPKPVDEDYQPFSAVEEQLAPGEEVYDIKQEFVDDAYIQEDLGQGKIASPSSDDESTVFNSTTDQVSSDEEAYDIKKEFVGTCYEDLPAIKTEPVSDYECDNPEDSDYDATLDEPDSTDATLEEPSTCEELEELEVVEPMKTVNPVEAAETSSGELPEDLEPGNSPVATSTPRKPSSSSPSALPSPPSSPSKIALPIPYIPVLLPPKKRNNENSENPGTEKYTELLRRRVEIKLFEKLDANLLSSMPLSPRTKKDIKTLRSTLRYCHQRQLYSDIETVEGKYMNDLSEYQVRQYRKRKAHQLEKIAAKRMRKGC